MKNAQRKCGLCGQTLDKCHLACTQTYSDEWYDDEPMAFPKDPEAPYHVVPTIDEIIAKSQREGK